MHFTNSNIAKLRLEPCILVTDRITVERGVTYHQHSHAVIQKDDGSEDSTWVTERHYKNREEATQANRVYANARNRIRSACVPTDLGFICSVRKEEDLSNAIKEAHEMVDEFNSAATHCHVRFKVLLTRIEPDNEAGMTELQEKLAATVMSLKSSLEGFDPTQARRTLAETKGLADVLAAPEARTAYKAMSDEARKIVREISAVIREYDGNVQNALESASGKQVLKRVSASWNF